MHVFPANGSDGGSLDYFIPLVFWTTPSVSLTAKCVDICHPIPEYGPNLPHLSLLENW